MLLIGVRFWDAKSPVDAVTLGLVGLGVLPWLTLFFKKFKVHGLVEGEAHNRAQGSSKQPPAPEPNAQAQVPNFGELPPSAKKVLRTLWRYQKELFKDFNRRWTFAIFPTAPDFPDYLEGVACLLKVNLVSMNPENHQVALTNEGIILMEPLVPQDIQGDFYVF